MSAETPHGLFRAALASPHSRHTYPLPTPSRSGAPRDMHAGGGEAVLSVHIPYCSERCTYCFVATQIGHDQTDMELYLDELATELRLAARGLRGYRFTSLHYGGGTPGLLSPAHFERLHAFLAPSLAPDATVTVETHPQAADAGRVRAWLDAGVDRVSLGVQTADAELLALVGREQTERHIRPALDRLLEAGFSDVNVDLLYGLPTQTDAQWEETLTAMLDAGVPSLSLYRTAFVPSTVAAFKRLGARTPVPERAQAMYDDAFERLNRAGYHQPRFGCSTFSRLGYPYGLNAHRRQLLEGRPMVGLGMGAYSSLPCYTAVNHRDRRAYRAYLAAGELPVSASQAVPEDERPYKYAVETWKLGFLCDDAYQRRFGEPLELRFGRALAALVELGELERVGAEYRLTRRGARHPDAIAELFLSPAARAAVSRAKERP